MKMHRIFPAFPLALALLSGGSACTPRGEALPDSEVVRAIEQHEERLRSAIVDADTLALGGLLAPEYLSTSAVGHTSNRAESMMAYSAGLVKVDSATVAELDVRRYGNTAVSLGFMRWSGTAASRPFSGTVRFQHVWVHDGNSWHLVASQLTNQPAAPRPPGGG